MSLQGRPQATPMHEDTRLWGDRETQGLVTCLPVYPFAFDPACERNHLVLEVSGSYGSSRSGK